MTALKKKQQSAIIESLMQGAPRVQACKAAGISRECYYNWRRGDEDFKEATNEAIESCIDIAEDVLYAEACKGTPSCLFFFLVNRRPEKWRHIQNVQHSGFVGTGITLQDLAEEAMKENGGSRVASRKGRDK